TKTAETETDPNAANNSASVTITGQAPDLTIAKSHVGSFVRGSSGSYSVTVSNIGPVASSGLVTVTDSLPAGLTPTVASGSGWSCGIAAQTGTCTRSDSLAATASYPVTTITVTVAQAASTPVTNTATVTTAGAHVNTATKTAEIETDPNAANDSASVTVNGQASDLTIAKSHIDPFVRGTSGSYSLVVSNIGTASTSGVVTVSDTLPAGLTPTSPSGSGWSCGIVAQVVTCTRSDVLVSSGSYPQITVTVAVLQSAAGALTNTASVTGGGE